MTQEYIIFFRGTGWDKGMSPQQLQESMQRFTAWFDKLTGEGKMKSGQPLFSEGKIVSSKGVADGPFAESKEAVGGYLLLNVANLDEAVAVAQTWPGLAYGGSVEVRPVAQECPLMARARELEHAEV